jgi:hypothetical protein
LHRFLALFVLALSPIPPIASADSFIPNDHPTLEVRRAPGAIEIDGDLSDPGWEGAARAVNFSETSPGDNVRPPVETEVLVTYDQERIYFAFLADDEPSEVRHSLRNRDEIWSDDYVGIILDTYGTASWAYEIFVNPLGIQGDLRWISGGEEDLGFDLVWESKGKITDRGFQVEVAVPFSSLRFPERSVQSWRATFWRNRPRESRCRYSWAKMDRDEPCWACNFGTLSGIRDVLPGKNIEFLPSLIAFQTREPIDPDDHRSVLESGDPQVETSLGVRYALSTSSSLQATINPDFSQVESDVAQVDVNTTFALFFPERRPFFQEGSDLFETWFPAVYTRSINDPQIAAKLTSRMERANFAYIGAYDEHSPIILPFEERSELLLTGKSMSNIVRYRHQFGQENHLGGVVTDRRWEGGSSGSFLAMDAKIRFLRNYRFEMQIATSHTEEMNDTTLTSDLEQETFDGGDRTAVFDGERFWGYGLYAGLQRGGRHWHLDLDYWERSPTLRAANGFLFRNDNREVAGWTGLDFQPNGRIIEEVFPNVAIGRLWNTRGVRKDEWLEPELSLRLKGQTLVEVSHLWSREQYRGICFDDIRRLTVEVTSEYLEAVRGGVEVSHVNHIARNLDPPAMGVGTNLGAWAQIKPMQRMVILPELSYASLYRRDDDAEIFSGYVLRTHTSFQFSREMSLRLIVQYDQFDDALDIEPLMSYRVNPFTIFYFGWTQQMRDLDATVDPVEARRQLFLKAQYLLQR